MHLFALIVAVCVGALLPLQALLNARLGQLTFGPLFASLASFAVGTSALLAQWTPAYYRWWMLLVGQALAIGTFLSWAWRASSSPSGVG